MSLRQLWKSPEAHDLTKSNFSDNAIYTVSFMQETEHFSITWSCKISHCVLANRWEGGEWLTVVTEKSCRSISLWTDLANELTTSSPSSPNRITAETTQLCQSLPSSTSQWPQCWPQHPVSSYPAQKQTGGYTELSQQLIIPLPD